MKKTSLMLLPMLIAALLSTTTAKAQGPIQPPTFGVFLQKFNRSHKPINEFCLNPNICGAPNSSLPNKKTVDSLYEQFDNGSVNKVRTTVNVSAPVYHSTSTITESYITNTVTGQSAGTIKIVSSSDGGVTNTTSLFPLPSLSIGELSSYGRLSRDVTNAAATAVNKIELIETSTSSLGIAGGTEGYEFTIILPFQVVEKTWDAQGNLVDVGVVSPVEITFLNGMARTVLDLGNGVCGIMFKIIGGGGFRKHDITPACYRAYYHYGFLPPQLTSVRKLAPNEIGN